jgi:hypothetical protein
MTQALQKGPILTFPHTNCETGAAFTITGVLLHPPETAVEICAGVDLNRLTYSAMS